MENISKTKQQNKVPPLLKDAASKTLFTNAPFLAYVLKDTVTELMPYSIQEIMAFCQKADIMVESIPLHDPRSSEEILNLASGECTSPPFLTGTRIRRLPNEDVSLKEGNVFFDIVLNLLIPMDLGGCIGVNINLEIQNDCKNSRKIIRRGIYYCSRLISRQRNLMFQKMEYEKLQKVYSIWLLPLADEKLGNTVRQISLKEKIILGENNDHASLPVEYYDMMELVVASMNGDYMPKAKPTVLELLWLVSTLNLDAGQKKQYLKEVFNMDVTEKMDEEIQSLYDQFRAYYGAKQFKQMWDETSRREFARAEALGAKKTRKEMVEILLKKGFSMKWIMDIYDLSEQQMLETLGRNKFNKYKV